MSPCTSQASHTLGNRAGPDDPSILLMIVPHKRSHLTQQAVEAHARRLADEAEASNPDRGLRADASDSLGKRERERGRCAAWLLDWHPVGCMCYLLTAERPTMALWRCIARAGACCCTASTQKCYAVSHRNVFIAVDFGAACFADMCSLEAARRCQVHAKQMA